MIYSQIYEAEMARQVSKNRNPNIQNLWFPYFGRIFSLYCMFETVQNMVDVDIK